MKLPIRRVGTGHNAEGKSIFVMDGPGPDRRGKGLFLTCVRDPDGNVVELIGPRAAR